MIFTKAIFAVIGGRPAFLRLWLITLVVLVESGDSRASWKIEREALDHQLRFDRFKVYFTTSGDAAFFRDLPPDTASMETKLFALRDQLLRGDLFYKKVLGLLPPPDSPKGLQAMSIHLHVLAMNKKMGSAGDTVQQMNYRYFKDNESALLIALNSRWKPGNVTPEHELFHLYQYGYTHFKNPWYLEGLAASMEFYFRNGLALAESEPLPKTAAEINSLLKRSYSAKVFWNKMLQSCMDESMLDKFGAQNLHSAEVSNNWLKALLEELAVQDAKAAKDRGFNPVRWSEKEQRSGSNHPYILQGVQNSLSQCKGKNTDEVIMFSRAIERYKQER